ncbi:mitochondrial import inner membrane translocase subunit tim21 [Aspergillus fumigatus]|nr:mitochondrial import inner membrane translocase subunit tim21 [Aspergillus fumigatus]KAH1772382.1 mitochondrial import inner membrane translocase subunit tim21 [Aspergillus fumigatus]KAH1944273.1 mitochondrial import inner membrane translocase subunit tim21 [Aspergillus fumigatus]KAH2508392.1 mitochondrial import inner membrane translocase subunit tim21 [Aspergillus fumigatus]KAH3130478.1 mitochondrial import inner membrane translocase subunit tim21 [Aspergillus fumigatus]
MMSPHLLPSTSIPKASAALLLRPAFPRMTTLTRFYATQSDLGGGSGSKATPRRRNVTVISDDGRYEWGELSGREKVARATQQSLNFLVIVAGAVLTGGVFYLLYTEVFSPNSRTWQFEKAVQRIKDDPRCTDLLGDRREIKAYGESTGSRWERNRPIATSMFKDRQGREHMKMHFHVEGPLNSGIVIVHMMKPLDKDEWEYLLLALDVKGHSRVILEQAQEKPGVAKALKIFGIQWR